MIDLLIALEHLPGLQSQTTYIMKRCLEIWVWVLMFQKAQQLQKVLCVTFILVQQIQGFTLWYS